MVSGPNEIWFAVSIDMREFSNDNKDYNNIFRARVKYRAAHQLNKMLIGKC